MSRPCAASLLQCSPFVNCLPGRCTLLGGRLPERPMGADCKSVAKASQVRILYLPPTSTQAGGCFRACRRGAWFAGTGNLTVLYLAAAAVRLAVAKRDMG